MCVCRQYHARQQPVLLFASSASGCESSCRLKLSALHPPISQLHNNDGAFAIFIWDSSQFSRTIMYSTLLYPLIACFSSTVLAKPLQAVDDQTVQADPDDLRLPSQSSSLPLTSNATSSLVNTSVSFDVSIKCDGDEYGFKPNVDDCTNALNRQLVGREQIIFGQRGSISSEKFFPLPYRLMGSKWLSRGPLLDVAITCQANRDAERRSALLPATSPVEWSRIRQCKSQSNP